MIYSSYHILAEPVTVDHRFESPNHVKIQYVFSRLTSELFYIHIYHKSKRYGHVQIQDVFSTWILGMLHVHIDHKRMYFYYGQFQCVFSSVTSEFL